MVKKGKWEFPDYRRRRCFICKKIGCLKKQGFYHRCVIDEYGKKIEDFPIQRYFCSNTQKKDGKKLTVSLLPNKLAPYHKYSIMFITKCIDILKKKKFRYGQALDKICKNFLEVVDKIEKSTIRHFYSLYNEAFNKYKLYKGKDTKYTIAEFITRCATSNNAVKFCVSYFENYKNYRFLFGTPFQFRKYKSSG